jgi:hydroxylamine dehydrogenase
MNSYKYILIVLILISSIFMIFISTGIGSPNQDESKTCITCHSLQGMGASIVQMWKDSKHFKNGIGCYDCHKAETADVDGFEHHGKRIATIVSPKDCAQCHEQEAAESDASHHAKGAQFIGSLDNILGEIVEGAAAANSGCRQCHGSIVQANKNGKLDAQTWPNTGIGRVNPDGSKGSCTACHSRHSFSVAQARQPEACGKCHMGPDHPQMEIYTESKHGIKFNAVRSTGVMNLEKDEWIVGKDYTAAPTCVTCHMSATPTQKVNHDIGRRISWTLRPPVSIKLDSADVRRDRMKNVCMQCHAREHTENFFAQYDEAVKLYNEKFGKPSKGIIDKFYADGKLTKTPFDEKLEWVYYELWHHEGRRARMGASMMGPDFTQWHGFYEVAKHFYNEFIPAAEEIQKGSTKDVMDSEFHKWKRGLTDEQKKEILDFYKKRYGE